jgi:signal transduction histidine kinase
MFDRAGEASQYQGSGLGLPISNDIVRAHGVRMWIERTPGEGTTSFFTIPRTRVTVNDADDR